MANNEILCLKSELKSKTAVFMSEKSNLIEEKQRVVNEYLNEREISKLAVVELENKVSVLEKENFKCRDDLETLNVLFNTEKKDYQETLTILESSYSSHINSLQHENETLKTNLYDKDIELQRFKVGVDISPSSLSAPSSAPISTVMHPPSYINNIDQVNSLQLLSTTRIELSHCINSLKQEKLNAFNLEKELSLIQQENAVLVRKLDKLDRKVVKYTNKILKVKV